MCTFVLKWLLYYKEYLISYQLFRWTISITNEKQNLIVIILMV